MANPRGGCGKMTHFGPSYSFINWFPLLITMHFNDSIDVNVMKWDLVKQTRRSISMEGCENSIKFRTQQRFIQWDSKPTGITLHLMGNKHFTRPLRSSDRLLRGTFGMPHRHVLGRSATWCLWILDWTNRRSRCSSPRAMLPPRHPMNAGKPRRRDLHQHSSGLSLTSSLIILFSLRSSYVKKVFNVLSCLCFLYAI